MSMLRPLFWEKKGVINYLLLPFSYIYFLLFELKFFLKTPYKSTMKTICVGNFTIGGAGKTPTVIEIAKYLTSKKKKFCIISRGYKGEVDGPCEVDLEIHNYKMVGDEPLILAKYGPVIVGKNKLEATKYAESLGYEYAIFDDGLQNALIDYDARILVYDTNFGNQMLFPAGPLREKIEKCAIRCDLIFSQIDPPRDMRLYEERWVKFTVKHDKQIFEKDERLVLFAGLANPNKFFNLASTLGGEVVKNKIFPDHHIYSNTDFEDLIKTAKNMEARLVTTEKDFIKVPDEYRKYITFLPIYYDFKALNKSLKGFL